MRSAMRVTAVLAGMALAPTTLTVASWAASPAGPTTTAHGQRWASAAKATVHPGVPVDIAGAKCVVGFVLTAGHRVFVAVPASCSGVSGGQPTDGCQEAQVPAGLPVTVGGARFKGTLVYSSFTQMQLNGETRANRCTANDLTLVRLDQRDVARTNPSVPKPVGGPTGLASTAPAQGDALQAYINAATTAVAGAAQNNGWAQQIVPFAAVSAADVGSPVLTSSGRALGMVSLVQRTEGGPATVSRLDHELAYLHHVSRFRHVQLAKGTIGFTAPAVVTP